MVFNKTVIMSLVNFYYVIVNFYHCFTLGDLMVLEIIVDNKLKRMFKIGILDRSLFSNNELFNSQGRFLNLKLFKL